MTYEEVITEIRDSKKRIEAILSDFEKEMKKMDNYILELQCKPEND